MQLPQERYAVTVFFLLALILGFCHTVGITCPYGDRCCWVSGPSWRYARGFLIVMTRVTSAPVAHGASI